MDAGECVRLRIQGIIAEEFEKRAVICVAAGLGEHVDLGALMPELRGVNTDLNFELLNGVNGRKDDITIEIRVRVIDAVEGVVVEHDALPARGYGLVGRSAPWRGFACPANGESVFTLGASPTRFRYCRPFSGSSVMILFSTTAPTVAVSACSRSAVAATSTVSLI